MPTYVYACKACGHEFEKFQSFNAKALRTCPECAEKALSKVIFPAGVVFKGAGFYINDSKRSTSATTGKDTSAENGSKGTKKGDSSKDDSSKDDAKKSDAKKGSNTSSKKESSSPSPSASDSKS